MFLAFFSDDSVIFSDNSVIFSDNRVRWQVATWG